VYIKGNITILIDNNKISHPNQNISAFGVNGLPWFNLNPKKEFGRLVEVLVDIQKPKPYSIRTLALILSEATPESATMVLKFHMDELQKQEFTAFIDKNGLNPIEYARKYPRIPSDALIQTFPMRALLTIEQSARPKPAPQSANDSKVPIIFDIENLSPTGTLMSTENQNALHIDPSDIVNVILEPRGWITTRVQIQCLVCRVTDELNPLNGNILRRLGLKFEIISPNDKDAFIALLKEILQEVKIRSDL
jgi:hypothetical protein